MSIISQHAPVILTDRIDGPMRTRNKPTRARMEFIKADLIMVRKRIHIADPKF